MDESYKKYSLCLFADGVMIVRSSWFIYDEEDLFCLCPEKLTSSTLEGCDTPNEDWRPHRVLEVLKQSGKKCSPHSVCD